MAILKMVEATCCKLAVSSATCCSRSVPTKLDSRMREYLLRGVTAGLLRSGSRGLSDLRYTHGGGCAYLPRHHKVRACMAHEGLDRLRPACAPADASAVIEATHATTVLIIDSWMLSSASVDRNWGSTPAQSRGAAAAVARTMSPMVATETSLASKAA